MLNLEMHIKSSCLDVYFLSQIWYSPVGIHVIIAQDTVRGLLRTSDILNIYICIVYKSNRRLEIVKKNINNLAFEHPP